MKTGSIKIWLMVCVVILASCDDRGIPQRPKDIIETEIDPAVMQKIVEQFPEGTNVQVTLPSLFEPAAQKQIVLSEESNVYLAYISEGASYANSFGWYSYNADNKPVNPSDVDVHLLFPHVSDKVLNRGDMLQLGDSKFPAGTVIGFFLIIHGWNNGEVNYNGETFYTDQGLNADDSQQHVLFRQKASGNLILSFEDQLTTQLSDKDFNDILFIVTDNKSAQAVSRINLTNVPELE
jgi:hypothetical protein